MKFYASRENLLKGVNTVQRAVTTKNPMPILGGILLTAENNTLKLTATDLEIGIECTVPITVVEPGSIVLPSRYLADVVRRLPDMRIDFQLNKDNNMCTLKYGASEISIHGMEADDFPLLPMLDREKSISISTVLLRNIIRQVVSATSSESNRPLFTGVLMEISENRITMVATDTHRLAYRSGKISTDKELGNISLIIAGKTLSEISRIINEESPVQITFTENQVLFENDNICLVSRLISGQYPNYLQVIPQTHKSRIRLKTKDLLESTERAALLSREGSNVIKVTVEENNMSILANSPEVGRVFEQIPAYLEGEETSISFNSRYLLDALKAVESEELYLELSGALSPGVIKPAETDNFLYLILPIRTL